jgi:serine/threonine protein kinase
MMLNFQERNSPFSKFPILGNRFILIRLLGKGGNGEVWDVIDYVDNKRRCALKISNSYHHSRREHLTHSVRMSVYAYMTFMFLMLLCKC